MNHILDNPIWNALNSGDAPKNIGNQDIAFYDAAIAPFIGMGDWDAVAQQAMIKNAPADRAWYLLIKDTIQWVEAIEIMINIPLYQMCCVNLTGIPKSKIEVDIVPLNESHIEEMVALTALTKPGPFLNRTIEFGNYHGIFQEGKLVAMGGERMHVQNFTEVSAICTHPDFQGLGLAGKMTHFITQSVLAKGQKPFLHVRVENIGAIEVYKRLGYEIRETIQFYAFKNK